MAHALLFALLAGLAMATYSIFLRLASSGIHPALGATHCHRGRFPREPDGDDCDESDRRSHVVTAKSLYFVIVVGVAAAAADLFTLSAYASGLKVTSSFVIGGTSTVLVLLIGFMILREPFIWLKLFSVALIATGVFLLQREGL